VLVALFTGAYLQETGGKVERLPAAVQPYARRVQAVFAPCVSSLSEALAPLAKKLNLERKKSVTLEEQCSQAVPENSAPREEVTLDITYADGPELYRKLKGVPTGSKIGLRQVQPRAAPGSCGTPKCGLVVSAAYEKRMGMKSGELERSINAELQRIQRSQ
jgi:hypothetical protein